MIKNSFKLTHTYPFVSTYIFAHFLINAIIYYITSHSFPHFLLLCFSYSPSNISSSIFLHQRLVMKIMSKIPSGIFYAAICSKSFAFYLKSLIKSFELSQMSIPIFNAKSYSIYIKF